MKNNNQLFIRFQSQIGFEIYKSPIFSSPHSLFENEDLNNLVVDGDEETGFVISCDMQMSSSHDVDHIIWEMFEPFDRKWISDLMIIWKKYMGFSLPHWDSWNQIPNLNEAYE